MSVRDTDLSANSSRMPLSECCRSTNKKHYFNDFIMTVVDKLMGGVMLTATCLSVQKHCVSGAVLLVYGHLSFLKGAPHFSTLQSSTLPYRCSGHGTNSHQIVIHHGTRKHNLYTGHLFSHCWTGIWTFTSKICIY